MRNQKLIFGKNPQLVWKSGICHQDTNFQFNPFLTNVPLMDKPGSWFFISKMFEKHQWKSDILSKDAGCFGYLVRLHFEWVL